METAPQHKNNFDFLRFLFASLVILSHSYILLSGNFSGDAAGQYTNRVFSDFAVCGFFVLSGFMIRQSLDRSASLSVFFKKRALRIFPGLWVAVALCVFVLGLALTSLPVSKYLTHSDTWKYLVSNAILMPLQKTLPGVFDNNVEAAVNGSLWTLRYEVLFYVLLSLLHFVPKSKIKIVSFSTLFICLLGNLLIKNEIIPVPPKALSFAIYFFSLGAYFSAGSCISLFPHFIKQHKGRILLISSVIFFASIFIFKSRLETIDILSYALMLISFGLHYFPMLNFSRYTGDISYGTYIYAYPIQQALIVCLHPANALALILPSLLLSWMAGWLSWHLVEKRFIKKKSVTHLS